MYQDKYGFSQLFSFLDRNHFNYLVRKYKGDITNASVHDSKVMKEIPIESRSYYIFDRAYNNFKELYRIYQAGGYFVVRAKKNLQSQTVTWKRRLPKNVWSDSLIRHLKIKKFWGTTENAVKIQIYCAITTYCLVAIVQKDMKL